MCEAQKDEVSQTYQLRHTKETQKLIPDKSASRLGLSYEGSSKKRKNAYLWTRRGPNCCTFVFIRDERGCEKKETTNICKKITNVSFENNAI